MPGPPVAGGGDLPVARSQVPRPHAGVGICARKGGVDRAAARALIPNGATTTGGLGDAAAAGRSVAHLLSGEVTHGACASAGLSLESSEQKIRVRFLRIHQQAAQAHRCPRWKSGVDPQVSAASRADKD